MNSIDKRNSVKKDYDLIANEYCDEFGTEIEDIEIIDYYLNLLKPNSKIIDLGGGSGRCTNYFNNKGHDAICYDFSINMMENAKKLFPNINYILDDMININKHFDNKSIDAFFCLYTLFHFPKEELKQLLIDIKNLLKDSGYLFASFQLGNGEEFVDEPYLKENGKNVLYMNYYSQEEIFNLLNECGFNIIKDFYKKEIGDNVIGEDGNDTLFVIAKKRS